MKRIKTQEAIGKLDLKGIELDVVSDRFSDKGWGKTSSHLPSEMALAIYVNRQQLVTILCTPSKLNCLVLGFLYAEGIIADVADVASMRVCEEESLADVMLSNPEYEVPTAPRQALVSWGELEVSNAPRRGQISWVAFEVPDAEGGDEYYVLVGMLGSW